MQSPILKAELEVLYASGEERARRYRGWLDGGILALELYVERSADGSTVSRRFLRYDETGRPVAEIEAVSGGSGRELRSTYGPSLLLSRAAFSYPGGDPLWTERYRYDRSGALRSVVRSVSPASSETLTLSTAEGVPRYLELSDASGPRSRIGYDASGAVLSETDPSGTRTMVQDGGSGARQTYTESATGRRIETVYGDDGLRTAEYLYGRDGTLLEQRRYERSPDGRLSSLTVIVDGSTTITRYDYSRDGAEASREQTRRDGVLERELLRDGSGGAVERLYRAGSLVMERSFRDGELLEEKTYRNGILVSSRSFQ